MFKIDYYRLDRAAEKIGCAKDDLIGLAVEGKLSLYVNGVPSAMRFDSSLYDEFINRTYLAAIDPDNFTHPPELGTKCHEPPICKIPVWVFQVANWYIKPMNTNTLHDAKDPNIFYRFDNTVKGGLLNLDLFNWFVSAEDVARLLKSTVSETEQTGAGNIEGNTKGDNERVLTPSNDNPKKEKELTRWLRETWINEGKPKGTAFFNVLKKYKGQKGSPIIDHYSSGKGAGIKWETSAGNSGDMTKKTILNKVSTFKNAPQQNPVNS